MHAKVIGLYLTKPYHIHVNAVGVRPSMLEVLLEALTERIRDLMEANELFNLLHLCMVAGCARVQPLYNGTHVPKDTGIHECCSCEVALTATAVHKQEDKEKSPLTTLVINAF